MSGRRAVRAAVRFAAVLAAVRFAAELAAVAIAALWGLRTTTSPLRFVAAVAGAGALMGVWGRWVAPKSATRLADPGRLAVEVAVFAVSGAALASLAAIGWGAGFAAVAIADALALRAGGFTTDAPHREEPGPGTVRDDEAFGA